MSGAAVVGPCRAPYAGARCYPYPIGFGFGWWWWWWVIIIFIFAFAWGGWGAWGGYPAGGWCGPRVARACKDP